VNAILWIWRVCARSPDKKHGSVATQQKEPVMTTPPHQTRDNKEGFGSGRWREKDSAGTMSVCVRREREFQGKGEAGQVGRLNRITIVAGGLSSKIAVVRAVAISVHSVSSSSYASRLGASGCE